MRLRPLSVRALVPIALAGLALGAVGAVATGAGKEGCARSGFFDNDRELGDGIFAAVIGRGCANAGRKTCTVADGTGPIASETVDRGIDQDCVAFNQFIGAGLNQIAYYVTGECFGKALVSSEPVFGKRLVHSKFRCKL